MAKKMLIDATHAESTRVAVVDGNRLIDFDFETESRKQLKGNIYLAKVIRIEPSLQAAFVEYGGNRHGFLAFTEIHHDYYRIPVADRQALEESLAQDQDVMDDGDDEQPSFDENVPFDDEEIQEDRITQSALPPAIGLPPVEDSGLMMDPFGQNQDEFDGGEDQVGDDGLTDETVDGDEPPVDMVGGDDGETDAQRERVRRRFIRRYKIQEVIKRGQIMLVQVVKEERGNKGAALTTYLSLAGRYCVLMPNTSRRTGGISRKITSMQDRRRMKDLLQHLEVPDGMAVILRTAGMERSEVEVQRDLEYLLRFWDTVREGTLKSIAPSLIYEEANLIKRSIRDLYAPDIDTILVEGEDGYARARDFMRMLMPTHARRVQHYRDDVIPLFFRYQVEGQINTLHSPVVQLRSGGYVVINQTEALVAIDVNSGKSTRERHIEGTALKTNLEAASEVARQLRLRDLAGLIVIDFIDMEDGRNNAAVERRLKEAMRQDRARVQIGRISHFGLLELSRQRLRPSLLELNFEKCPHCHGTGQLRLAESSALLALHAIEEEGIRQQAAEISIQVPEEVSLYVFNNKRELLNSIERRYAMKVHFNVREDVIAPDFPIDRLRNKKPEEKINTSIANDEYVAEEDIDDSFDARNADEDSGDAMGAMSGPVGDEFSSAEGNVENFDGNRGDHSKPRNARRRGRRGGRNRNNGDRNNSDRNGDRIPAERNHNGGGRFRDANRPEGDPQFVDAPREPAQQDAQRREGRYDRNAGRNNNSRQRDNRPRRDHRGPRRDGQGGNPDGNFGNNRPINVPINVMEIDTTPKAEPANKNRHGHSDNQTISNQGMDSSPEKKKTGWWHRLTGAN